MRVPPRPDPDLRRGVRPGGLWCSWCVLRVLRYVLCVASHHQQQAYQQLAGTGLCLAQKKEAAPAGPGPSLSSSSMSSRTTSLSTSSVFLLLFFWGSWVASCPSGFPLRGSSAAHVAHRPHRRGGGPGTPGIGHGVPGATIPAVPGHRPEASVGLVVGQRIWSQPPLRSRRGSTWKVSSTTRPAPLLLDSSNLAQCPRAAGGPLTTTARGAHQISSSVTSTSSSAGRRCRRLTQLQLRITIASSHGCTKQRQHQNQNAYQPALHGDRVVFACRAPALELVVEVYLPILEKPAESMGNITLQLPRQAGNHALMPKVGAALKCCCGAACCCGAVPGLGLCARCPCPGEPKGTATNLNSGADHRS